MRTAIFPADNFFSRHFSELIFFVCSIGCNFADVVIVDWYAILSIDLPRSSIVVCGKPIIAQERVFLFICRGGTQ